MDPAFWRDRWSQGAIGFHEGRANAFLLAHAERLTGRVLVPLCGKSEDLAFLAARGHDVIGVELVEDAVRAFFAEHALAPTITLGDRWTRYATGPFTVLAGDLFGVTREDVGDITSIYDRAALIALPAALRPKYAAHLRSLAPHATILAVTLEYPQALRDGPPFAVLEPELRALYPGESIELVDDAPAGGRIGDAGIGARERCFTIAP